LVRFILNNKEIITTKPSGTPLLEFLRYHQHLAGTKTGCNEGDCGACTVLIGELVNGALQYRSYTSCLAPLANVHGRHVVTIEGLNPRQEAQDDKTVLNPVQLAMYESSATQCGFCTPGFVVSFAAYCLSDKPPTKEAAISGVEGNICRCTGYKSIERAAAKIAELMRHKPAGDKIEFLISNKFLPAYFSTISRRLLALDSNENGIEEIPGMPLLVAGGTDLYVQNHEEIKDLQVRKIQKKKNGHNIYSEGVDGIIEANTTVSELLESKLMNQYFPKLEKHIRLVSSTQIRNMATIAGNFINASPIGDFTIFFLALNARLLLSDGINERILPLRNLYKGYKSLEKSKEEHIKQIIFTLPGENAYFNFEKVSKRTNLDIASVNSAIQLVLNGQQIIQASLAAGGVGPIPKWLSETSAFLKNKTITPAVISDALAIAQQEISPISDVRGSEKYKRLLLDQLIKAHFIELFPALSIHV
jgi:xanthine dehydrogenase small subunit